MQTTTHEPPAPKIRRSRGISVIWTLPIIALAICGWLLYQSIENAGIEITVYFDNASGLTPGKTQVMSKGIPVGLVKKLEPDLVRNQVRATIEMEKSLEPHLVSDTLFWVVRPELSAASIQGLETIVTGSYIGIRGGTSKKERRTFDGLDSPPPIAKKAPGLHISLRTETLGSIQKQTGIFFKNIEIGQVQGFRLTDENNILIDVYIEPEYSNIIKEESRFANASGIDISGELTNLKVHIESLSALLRGGILVHTPKEMLDSPPAQSGQTYKLYKDLEDANYSIPMSLELASGADIVEGTTKVMYRGIEAGFVKKIAINDDKNKSVTAHVQLDPRAEFILRENTVFWLVKPAISPAGVENIRTLLTGSHITFKAGNGEFKNHFSILPEAPPLEPLRDGKYLQLISANSINLTSGAPVYFKDIQVGEVISVALEPKSTNILTTIFIYQDNSHLVANNSVFWLQSGIDIKADLSGLTINSGPLTRILAGGIVFTTPEQSKESNPSFPKKSFTLYKDYQSVIEATADLQQQGIRFQLKTAKPDGITINTPIIHKSIIIGKVTGLSFTAKGRSVLVDCFIEEKFSDLLNSSTQFHTFSGIELSGGLDGINFKVGPVESILKGGIACVTVPGSKPFKPKHPLPLYGNIEDILHAKDTHISVLFKNSGGLKPGSPLRYKGVTVGNVIDVSLEKDLSSVRVKVRLDSKVVPLFRTTTRIWRVEPEISFNGVKNVETALTGSYLTFFAGAGKPTREFTALSGPPQLPFADQEGLPLILETNHLGSLDIGSPLYYREMKVGTVTGFELAPSFRKIFIFVLIDKKYDAIVRDNTRFWNISGARVSGGLLSGITLSTGSIESLIRGGIALATPNNEQAGETVEDGYHFLLHDTPEPEWTDWNPDLVLMGE